MTCDMSMMISLLYYYPPPSFIIHPLSQSSFVGSTLLLFLFVIIIRLPPSLLSYTVRLHPSIIVATITHSLTPLITRNPPSPSNLSHSLHPSHLSIHPCIPLSLPSHSTSIYFPNCPRIVCIHTIRQCNTLPVILYHHSFSHGHLIHLSPTTNQPITFLNISVSDISVNITTFIYAICYPSDHMIIIWDDDMYNDGESLHIWAAQCYPLLAMHIASLVWVTT